MYAKNKSSDQKSKNKSKPKSVSLGTFLAGINEVDDLSSTLHVTNVSTYNRDAITAFASATPGVGNNIGNVPIEPPYVAYLQNLPFEVDEEAVRELFPRAQICSVNLPKHRRFKNKTQGFAHVEFANREDFINVLKSKDTICHGRRLRIQMCKSQERPNSQPAYLNSKIPNRESVEDFPELMAKIGKKKELNIDMGAGDSVTVVDPACNGLVQSESVNQMLGHNLFLENDINVPINQYANEGVIATSKTPDCFGDYEMDFEVSDEISPSPLVNELRSSLGILDQRTAKPLCSKEIHQRMDTRLEKLAQFENAHSFKESDEVVEEQDPSN